MTDHNAEGGKMVEVHIRNYGALSVSWLLAFWFVLIAIMLAILGEREWAIGLVIGNVIGTAICALLDMRK